MKNVFMAGVFITLLFCGSPSLSWATSSHTVETVQQKQKIAGVVVDQNGEPIIGANISSNPQLSSSASFLRLNVLSSLN